MKGEAGIIGESNATKRRVIAATFEMGKQICIKRTTNAAPRKCWIDIDRNVTRRLIRRARPVR